VPQQLNEITIQFRDYGVKLNFEPIVQDNGLIRLHVGPEVSQLDQTNAIKINGVQVPGLITRRADTTVEIADGDSLAIGGLFQHDYANDLRQFPVLGSIPILGTLFRSARWNRNETELIIVVTPHVVTAEDFRRSRVAAVEGKDPNPFDFVVGGHALDKPMANDIRGPAAPTAASPAPNTPPSPPTPQLRGAIAPKAVSTGK
jgi:pilus assembly protein CpaC